MVHLTQERIIQPYEVFQDDMPGDLRQLQNEVCRRKAIWEMTNVAEKPHTLDETIQEIIPDLYPNTTVIGLHCFHSSDDDVCSDSHRRALLQCNAATQELSALYNDN